MITWTLIIWVLHSQLALTGYDSKEACEIAAVQARDGADAGRTVTVYCINGGRR
jgi:hypothetical protein